MSRFARVQYRALWRSMGLWSKGEDELLHKHLAVRSLALYDNVEEYIW